MKNQYKRVIIIILDSVGCGIQGDYKKYHSCESNTLQSIYKSENKFSLPNLEQLGLLQAMEGDVNPKNRKGISGKMREQTSGNDTFAGVWEMFGTVFSERLRSRKTGFPKQSIKEINAELGVEIVGNEYISGFKALDKYYDEHAKKKGPILYFADDGVILLAAHEKIIPAQKLNIYGKKLAVILKGHKISRVITRPFIGEKGNFIRTERRRDYLALDNLEKESILPLLRRGKIPLITTEHLFNIFGHPQGAHFIKGNHTNNELIPLITDCLDKRKSKSVMLFCLQDFDMHGHKKDVKGYARSLSEFDALLPKILESLKQDDLLFITADHGCDPTTDLRGHTREYVPLLAYSPRLEGLSVYIGKRKSFADLAQTICHNFKLGHSKKGDVIYEVF